MPILVGPTLKSVIPNIWFDVTLNFREIFHIEMRAFRNFSSNFFHLVQIIIQVGAEMSHFKSISSCRRRTLLPNAPSSKASSNLYMLTASGKSTTKCYFTKHFHTRSLFNGFKFLSCPIIKAGSDLLNVAPLSLY